MGARPDYSSRRPGPEGVPIALAGGGPFASSLLLGRALALASSSFLATGPPAPPGTTRSVVQSRGILKRSLASPRSMHLDSLVLAALVALGAGRAAISPAPAGAESLRITVLHTTDLHGALT